MRRLYTLNRILLIVLEILLAISIVTTIAKQETSVFSYVCATSVAMMQVFINLLNTQKTSIL